MPEPAASRPLDGQSLAAATPIGEVAPDRGSAERTATEGRPVAAEPLIEDDVLLEDVSIDGMCGVY
jgi:mycofactocin precursor